MDPRTLGLLLNTVCLAAGTVAVSLPIGTFLAVLIVKTDLPGRRIIAILLTSLLFVPLFAVAGAWEAGFGLSGWYTRITPSLFGDASAPLLSGWPAVIWIHGAASVPWVVLIVGLGLRAVEADLEDDALLDANSGRVLWHVTLRRGAPSLGVAAACVAVAATGEMTVTDLFRIRTFAEEVYTQAAGGSLLDPLVSGTAQNAAGLPISSLSVGWGVCGILLVVTVLACKRLAVDAQFAVSRSVRRIPLRRWKWPAVIGSTIAMVLLIGIPFGNLLAKAGTLVVETDTGRERTWSAIQAVERIAASPLEHQRELLASLAIGAAAAIAATATAIALAGWARRGGWRFGLLLVITAACLMTPAPILGVGTIWLLNQPPASVFSALALLYDSPAAPWFVQTVRALPFAVLVLWAALASVPQSSLDAAKSEGAGPMQRLIFVALPQRRSAVILALGVCLAIAMGELAATVLVVPPGTTPISVRAFNLLHYGVEDRLAALVLFLYLSAVIGTLVVAMAWRWKKTGSP